MSGWQQLQAKAFRRWCNHRLSQRGMHIESFDDLTNGVLLLNLLEIVSDSSVKSVLGRNFIAAPRFRLQMSENASAVVSFLKEYGIDMTNVGANDIVDGNERILLGIVWRIISKLDGDRAEDAGELLSWCTAALAPLGITVTNWRRHWESGLAFCGLVAALDPSAIDMAAARALPPARRLELATAAAADRPHVESLIDIDDICDDPDADEALLLDDKVVRAYVAEFRRLARERELAALEEAAIASSADDNEDDVEFALDSGTPVGHSSGSAAPASAVPPRIQTKHERRRTPLEILSPSSPFSPEEAVCLPPIAVPAPARYLMGQYAYPMMRGAANDPGAEAVEARLVAGMFMHFASVGDPTRGTNIGISKFRRFARLAGITEARSDDQQRDAVVQAGEAPGTALQTSDLDLLFFKVTAAVAKREQQQNGPGAAFVRPQRTLDFAGFAEAIERVALRMYGSSVDPQGDQETVQQFRLRRLYTSVRRLIDEHIMPLAVHEGARLQGGSRVKATGGSGTGAGKKGVHQEAAKTAAPASVAQTPPASPPRKTSPAPGTPASSSGQSSPAASQGSSQQGPDVISFGQAGDPAVASTVSAATESLMHDLYVKRLFHHNAKALRGMFQIFAKSKQVLRPRRPSTSASDTASTTAPDTTVTAASGVGPSGPYSHVHRAEPGSESKAGTESPGTGASSSPSTSPGAHSPATITTTATAQRESGQDTDANIVVHTVSPTASKSPHQSGRGRGRSLTRRNQAGLRLSPSHQSELSDELRKQLAAGNVHVGSRSPGSGGSSPSPPSRALARAPLHLSPVSVQSESSSEHSSPTSGPGYGRSRGSSSRSPLGANTSSRGKPSRLRHLQTAPGHGVDPTSPPPAGADSPGSGSAGPPTRINKPRSWTRDSGSPVPQIHRTSQDSRGTPYGSDHDSPMHHQSPASYRFPPGAPSPSASMDSSPLSQGYSGSPMAMAQFQLGVPASPHFLPPAFGGSAGRVMPGAARYRSYSGEGGSPPPVSGRRSSISIGGAEAEMGRSPLDRVRRMSVEERVVGPEAFPAQVDYELAVQPGVKARDRRRASVCSQANQRMTPEMPEAIGSYSAEQLAAGLGQTGSGAVNRIPFGSAIPRNRRASIHGVGTGSGVRGLDWFWGTGAGQFQGPAPATRHGMLHRNAEAAADSRMLNRAVGSPAPLHVGPIMQGAAVYPRARVSATSTPNSTPPHASSRLRRNSITANSAGQIANPLLDRVRRMSIDEQRAPPTAPRPFAAVPVPLSALSRGPNFRHERRGAHQAADVYAYERAQHQRRTQGARRFSVCDSHHFTAAPMVLRSLTPTHGAGGMGGVDLTGAEPSVGQMAAEGLVQVDSGEHSPQYARLLSRTVSGSAALGGSAGVAFIGRSSPPMTSRSAYQSDDDAGSVVSTSSHRSNRSRGPAAVTITPRSRPMGATPVSTIAAAAVANVQAGRPVVAPEPSDTLSVQSARHADRRSGLHSSKSSDRSSPGLGRPPSAPRLHDLTESPPRTAASRRTIQLHGSSGGMTSLLKFHQQEAGSHHSSVSSSSSSMSPQRRPPLEHARSATGSPQRFGSPNSTSRHVSTTPSAGARAGRPTSGSIDIEMAAHSGPDAGGVSVSSAASMPNASIADDSRTRRSSMETGSMAANTATAMAADTRSRSLSATVAWRGAASASPQIMTHRNSQDDELPRAEVSWGRRSSSDMVSSVSHSAVALSHRPSPLGQSSPLTQSGASPAVMRTRRQSIDDTLAPPTYLIRDAHPSPDSIIHSHSYSGPQTTMATAAASGGRTSRSPNVHTGASDRGMSSSPASSRGTGPRNSPLRSSPLTRSPPSSAVSMHDPAALAYEVEDLTLGGSQRPGPALNALRRASGGAIPAVGNPSPLRMQAHVPATSPRGDLAAGGLQSGNSFPTAFSGSGSDEEDQQQQQQLAVETVSSHRDSARRSTHPMDASSMVGNARVSRSPVRSSMNSAVAQIDPSRLMAVIASSSNLRSHRSQGDDDSDSDHAAQYSSDEGEQTTSSDGQPPAGMPSQTALQQMLQAELASQLKGGGRGRSQANPTKPAPEPSDASATATQSKSASVQTTVHPDMPPPSKAPVTSREPSPSAESRTSAAASSGTLTKAQMKAVTVEVVTFQDVLQVLRTLRVMPVLVDMREAMQFCAEAAAVANRVRSIRDSSVPSRTPTSSNSGKTTVQIGGDIIVDTPTNELDLFGFRALLLLLSTQKYKAIRPSMYGNDAGGRNKPTRGAAQRGGGSRGRGGGRARRPTLAGTSSASNLKSRSPGSARKPARKSLTTTARRPPASAQPGTRSKPRTTEAALSHVARSIEVCELERARSSSDPESPGATGHEAGFASPTRRSTGTPGASDDQAPSPADCLSMLFDWLNYSEGLSALKAKARGGTIQRFITKVSEPKAPSARKPTASPTRPRSGGSRQKPK